MKNSKKKFMKLQVFDGFCKRFDTRRVMFIEFVCGNIVNPGFDVNYHWVSGMSTRMIQIICIRYHY